MNCYDLSINVQKRHLCLLNSFLDIVKRNEIDNDSAVFYIEESISEYHVIAMECLRAGTSRQFDDESFELVGEEANALMQNLQEGRKVLDQIVSIVMEKLQS